MKQEYIFGAELAYTPCRYGSSRMLFRGPRRRLDRPYIAFLGGTETFGKYIERPFPALIEKEVRQTCVNLGCVHGGIDTYVNDKTVMDICSGADMTVLQITASCNMSNRFYSVHPRRNDRFQKPSTVLKAIYDDVDFSEFSFTAEMLGALMAASPDRFDILVAELSQAWIARMRQMLHQIGRNVTLLWLSKEELTDTHWSAQINPLKTEPLFVTRSMVEELRPLVSDIVQVKPSRGAIAEGTRGMVFPEGQEKEAAQMMGLAGHAEVSDALINSLRQNLRAA